MSTIFRLRGINCFLTWPQCPIDKQYAYDFIKRNFACSRVIVSHELHADGSDHLHAYVELLHPIDTRNCHYFDLSSSEGVVYHGNYQTCRKVNDCVLYVAKKGEYVSNFEPGLTKSTKPSKRAEIAKELLGKRTLEDLIRTDHPELLFGYSKLKVDIDYFKAVEAFELLPRSVPFLPNPWGLLLPFHRHEKRRHYWLYSTVPSLGKTTQFAVPLRTIIRAVVTAGISQYWNVTSDVSCVILDDFNTAALKWSDLNQMCDGTYGYRVFMRGTIVLSSPLIIVISNQSIPDLYPHMNSFLYSRFNEICLDRFKH